MINNLPNIYKEYKTYSKEDIDYKLYKNICLDFNELVFENLREGKVFNMGFRLSHLEILQVDRTFKKPKVNIYETKKLREAGEDGVVYWTDDFYCRHYWNKYKCVIKNRTFYKFCPTRGLKGNKEKLVNLLQSDPLSHNRFRKVEEL